MHHSLHEGTLEDLESYNWYRMQLQGQFLGLLEWRYITVAQAALVASLLSCSIQGVIITFKALYGMDPGNLNKCLPQWIGPPHLHGAGGRACWRTPPVKEFWLAGSKRRVFSAMVPAVWNIVTPHVARSWPSKRAWKPGFAKWPGSLIGTYHTESS